jgi:glutamate dehydrogenase
LNTSSKTWHVALQQLTERALGPKAGRRLLKKYHSLLTDFYRQLVSPRYALKDMLQLDRIAVANCQRVSLLNPGQHSEHYRLHFYSQQERYLDEYIPVLENLSFS